MSHKQAGMFLPVCDIPSGKPRPAGRQLVSRVAEAQTVLRKRHSTRWPGHLGHTTTPHRPWKFSFWSPVCSDMTLMCTAEAGVARAENTTPRQLL